MHHTKENIFGELFVTRYPHLKWQDSPQLEDWLTDTETASELTGESRTKIAQAKSKGLVRTLVSEALTAHKMWEEIKLPLIKNIKHGYSHIN